MPPPATPMLPSKSWTMALVRMICTPMVCWVQPRAYMMVPALLATPVAVKASYTLSILSLGTPVMSETLSRVL